jgi:hypothetical protein
MIERDVKKSLDLRGMKIHGENPVGAGGGEQDWPSAWRQSKPGLVFAVLPGITEIGNHGGYPLAPMPALRHRSAEAVP